MAYEYNKWDFSKINEIVNYMIYEAWKLPIQAWQWIPQEARLTIKLVSILIIIIVLIYFWNKRDEWQHVHTSSINNR